MFDSFILILILIIIFGALFFVFKFTSSIKSTQTGNAIGKTLVTFPISYKSNGYIIKVCDKYYLCCENCGMIEIDYSSDLDKAMESNTFQSIVASEFEKLKKIKNINNTKIKNNK